MTAPIRPASQPTLDATLEVLELAQLVDGDLGGIATHLEHLFRHALLDIGMAAEQVQRPRDAGRSSVMALEHERVDLKSNRGSERSA